MLIFIVCATFFMYVLLDCISIIPRISGASTGNNALAYSFSVMINTLKRVFIVSYPPVLGWISVYSQEDLLLSIYLSYFFSVFAVLMVFIFRGSLISFFGSFLFSYSKSGHLIGSFFSSFSGPKIVDYGSLFSVRLSGFNFELLLLATWVYLVYGSSLFVINIFGAAFSDYAPVVYQLVGLVNALGTIVFAFLLDPKVSRICEASKEEDLVFAHNSLLLAQLLGLSFFGPLVIYLLSLFLL